MNDRLILQDGRQFWDGNVAEPRKHPDRAGGQVYTTDEASLKQLLFERDLYISGIWFVDCCYFEGRVVFDNEQTRFTNCYFYNGAPELEISQ